MKKIFSILLGIAAGYSVLAGFFLLISNIQGRRVPDGHPLDPEWLVWGLLVVVPGLAGLLAMIIWPEDQGQKKDGRLYKGHAL
jgi:hypothetical protein